MNDRLAAAGSNLRVLKAEVIYTSEGFDAATSTVILANDRTHTTGAAWVQGDPRRAGRRGLSYAIGSNTGGPAFVLNDARTAYRPLTPAEVEARIEEGMAAWTEKSCMGPEFERVAVPAGTDPDFSDQHFRGQGPSANYSQPADVVHGGWQPMSFFTGFAGPSGVNILGVTFSFGFTQNGVFTDIDRNGKPDLALTEIQYNGAYGWANDGTPRHVDFFSIIAHESGHAIGIGHFGKVFVTKKDAEDDNGMIFLDEVKFAPMAMMNAVYFAGTQNTMRGTDNGSFCQLWASK